MKCMNDAAKFLIEYCNGDAYNIYEKCEKCIMNDICPTEKRKLKLPKSISIKGMTVWQKGSTDEGGGGGIMS